MKNLSKILAMLLVVVMCVGLFGGSAFAAGEVGGEIRGTFDNPYPGGVDETSGNKQTGNGNVTDTDEVGGGVVTDPTTKPALLEDPDVALYVHVDDDTAAGNPVARFGSTDYTTLEAAAAAANTAGSGTVTLLRNTSNENDSDQLSFKTGIVLDLSGYTLRVSQPIQVSGSGTFTVKNGTLEYGSTAAALASMDGAGTLKLSNVISGLSATEGIPSVGYSGKIVFEGAGTNFEVTNPNFYNKSVVTVNAGTYYGASPKSCVPGTVAVTNSSDGGWIVGESNSVATINSDSFASVDLAMAAAKNGDVINIVTTATEVDMTADLTDGRTVTIYIGNRTLNSDALSISGNSTLRISGQKMTCTSIGIGGGSTLGLVGSADTQVSGNISIAEGGTLDIASPANIKGSVTNSGTVKITGSGAAIVNSLTMAGSSLVMNNPNAVVGTLTLDSTTSTLYVSDGKVNDTVVSAASGVPSITGGTWGGVSSAELPAFKSFVASGYTAVASGSDYIIDTTSSTSSTGTVSQTVSGSYSYYLDSDVTNSALGYNVKVPAGDAYNAYKIACYDSTGAYLCDLTPGSDYSIAKKGDSGDSVCTLSTSGPNLDNLPADKVTLRFVFTGTNGANSFVNQYIYVIPEVTNGDRTYVTNQSDKLEYVMSNPSVGGYLISSTNSISSATVLSGDNYTESGNTLRLNNSYLNGLSNGTYYMWFRYVDGKGAPMPSFNVNAAGTSTGVGDGSGSGSGSGSGVGSGSSTSTGEIVVKPVYDGYWYYGDGNLQFRVNDEVTYIKVDEFKVGVLDYIDNDDYYITLGQDYLETLSNGWHTLTVYNNTKSGSCTFYVGPSLVPKDTDKHTIGSSLNLKFVCSDPIARVYVGDKTLDTEYYSLSSNGKVVTLTAEFLNNRIAGNSYNISVLTQDGETASSTFRILTKAQASASPKTGDTSNLVLWTIVLAMSGAAAVVVLPKLKKHED